MTHQEESFNTWNKVASLYSNKFMNLEIYNATYDAFCDSLKDENSSVLDVACGPGNISKYILKKSPELSILGLDTSPNMIDLAKSNNPGAEFLVMDARTMTSFPQKFDGIIAGFYLPYLTEKETADFFSTCFQLLNSNAVLYCSFVDGNSESSGFKTGSSGDRVYFNYHQLETITQLLHKNQFENPKVYKVNYLQNDGSSEIHCILISKKLS